MSRRPEKAVREGISDDEGDIEKLPIGKFGRYKNPLVEQSNQMDGSMAPMIAWAFQRAALDSDGFSLRTADIHRHAALLAKPHVGHSFFVEHPAARIDHERDHEKVNGTTIQAIHISSLNGTAIKRNHFQEDVLTWLRCVPLCRVLLPIPHGFQPVANWRSLVEHFGEI